MIALISLPSRQFTSCRQDGAPYGPWHDRAQRCSDEDVRKQVRPRLAVSPEGVLRRAEYVRVACEDCDKDARNGNRLENDVENGQNRQQMFVRAKTGLMDTDRVIHNRNPHQPGHAEPLYR